MQQKQSFYIMTKTLALSLSFLSCAFCIILSEGCKEFDSYVLICLCLIIYQGLISRHLMNISDE